MTNGGETVEWTEGVISFIQTNLPKLDRNDDWHHMFIAAYQLGCEALAALGHARETD